MKPEVSVLIPVYNASSFIEKCADSLFQQTFENIEYIFVNDCTPDDSMEKLNAIIDKYPHRKNQIKILNHSSNCGSGTARNTALSHSSGTFISFIDSDDFIEPDMIEKLYQKAIEDKADIVVCDVIKEYKDKSVLVSDYIGADKKESFKSMIENKQSHSYLCNKLVKRELYMLEDCRIPDGLNYMEDRYVMTRLYYYSNVISKVNLPLYHYVHYNENSITTAKNEMHLNNLIQFWSLLESFLIDNHLYIEYKDIIGKSKIEDKVRAMFGVKNALTRKKFAHIFEAEEKEYIGNFKLSERLMLFLLRNNMWRSAHLLRQIIWFRNN